MAKKLRVANIIEEGRLGGPQVRMVRVSEELCGIVDTLIFMPTESSSEFQSLCKTYGVEFQALPLTRVTKDLKTALRYIIFSPAEVINLAINLRRNKIDVVHVSGGSWQYKGIIAAKIVGVPSIWHLNDAYIPSVFKKLFNVLSGLASSFIFASYRTKDYYQSGIDNKKPFYVIPSPVNVSLFDRDQDLVGDEDLIREWGDDIVLGTTSNVNPVKGLETLISAASCLADSKTNIRFVVIGMIAENQKNYYHRLLSLAKELNVHNVEFLGPRQDVRPLLKRFDLYICSSVSESSPIAVWEAMAMSLPIISTDVGDVPVHVSDGENGYIVPVADYQSMAVRIQDVCQDSAQRVRMGERSREIAIEHFSTKKIGQSIFEAYRAAADKK